MLNGIFSSKFAAPQPAKKSHREIIPRYVIKYTDRNGLQNIQPIMLITEKKHAKKIPKVKKIAIPCIKNI
jgi:hypothetical protein